MIDYRRALSLVSACFSGGFIDAVNNDLTMVITAARHDRKWFGCTDDNDITCFGRAFFKEALSDSRSLEEAFAGIEALVTE